ncbi:hypothetical protein MHU86_10384 [Fragilaria crotonensis]|nr:hypothetical protein MHU86_10384 [Fragilaria crotonensis]
MATTTSILNDLSDAQLFDDARSKPFDETDATSGQAHVDGDGINAPFPVVDPTDQDGESTERINEIPHDEGENGQEVAMIDTTLEDNGNAGVMSSTIVQSPYLTKHDDQKAKDIYYAIMPSHTIETQKSEDVYQVVEEAYDEETGQEIMYKQQQSWHFPPNRRYKRLFCLLCSAFVLLTIVIGSIFGVKYGNQGNSSAETPLPAPTSSPVSSPTNGEALIQLLRNISGSRLDDPDSPQHNAASILSNETRDSDVDEAKTIQRYAMLTMVGSLLIKDMNSIVHQDECDWTFTTCTSSGRVTALAMARMELEGEIPPEISHLQGLIKLDLASNSIRGSLPEEFFTLTALKFIYLDSNQLIGTINPSINNMTQLEHLYIGKNQFSGAIPGTLPSTLRHISVYKNDLAGALPNNFLKPNDRFYVDLSFNALTGTLPSNAASLSLRHLYLSHNQFRGEIPRAFALLQLENLFLDHNLLTGVVPTDFSKDYLSTLQLQGNDFSALDSSLCQLDITQEGVLIDLAANCSICTCDGRLCDACFE